MTRRGRAVSQGGAVAELAVTLGRPLFGWQRRVADVALERHTVGGERRWRYPIVTVSVPRQSGKTTITGLVAVHRCLSVPGASVWYTAQSRQDAVLRWRDVVALLRRSSLRQLDGQPRNAPADGSWDYRVRGHNGAETVEWANGSQLRVFAPAEDSLHGSVTDLVVLDEARFYDEARGRALMAAVMPSQATRDGQVWIVSTAGGPASVFLAGELEAGRAGIDDPKSRRCHAEWGLPADDLDDGASDLLDRVWAAHPSAGWPGGPGRDALTVACESMPGWQFAHEYGNRWRNRGEERLLPAAAWERARSFAALGDAAPTFGVDVAVDRSAASIVACVDSVCQLVEHRPGAEWVTGRVRELVERWDPAAVAIDAAGAAGAVAEDVRAELGDRLVTTSTRDLAAACGGFYDALAADPPEVQHRPSTVLDDAAATAAQRRIGQAWVFSRTASGPALLAMVLAWWAHKRAPDVEPPQWWIY